MRIFICLCLILWLCMSHGQCNAQAITPTHDSTVINGKRYKDTAHKYYTTWYVDSAGDPALDTTKLLFKSNGSVGYRMFTNTYLQNVVIQGWDTANIIYYHKTPGSKPGWDARASADTIYFRIPPKKIIIGKDSYSTLFLNGHWVLMWDSKSH